MKIEQQLYTRERRGLFRQSEGYDTVAKSPGLSDAFVKEKLHPYCVYAPPHVAPPHVAPLHVALTVAHFPCGRMLLGQAAHVPADFTGQRAAFFAHNYVIPPAAAGELLADMGKLLRTRFETAYDIGLGGALDALDALPVNPAGCGAENSRQTSGDAGPAIHIDEGLIARLAHCAGQAAAGSKKVFVLVPARDMHEYVCGLLAELYRRLPEGVRHRLGFCTRAREPERRKGIHLLFLEEGAVKAGDSRVAGDFVIDVDAERGFHDGSQEGTAKKRGGPEDRSPCEPTDNLAAYISGRIPSLAPERFFAETEFWRARAPALRGRLEQTERGWLDANLDRLTQAQLAAAPEAFIRRGKKAEEPAVYMALSVLKAAAGALAASRAPLDMRYFLGSYPFADADYRRVVQNLLRLPRPYSSPDHLENIAFLFRARETGRLDAEGLNAYLEARPSGVNAR